MIPADLLPTSFRDWFYYRKLRGSIYRDTTKRETVPLQNASSAALLFEATQPENIVRVNSFAEKLTKNGIKVEMLGFVNRKMTGQDVHHFSWFGLQDLNWYGAPITNRRSISATKVREFTKKRFDLLINAWIEDVKPLNWIAAQSKARFRIGPYREHGNQILNLSEFMISLPPDNCNLDYFFEQLDHYLNKLHTNTRTIQTKQKHA